MLILGNLGALPSRLKGGVAARIGGGATLIGGGAPLERSRAAMVGGGATLVGGVALVAVILTIREVCLVSLHFQETTFH